MKAMIAAVLLLLLNLDVFADGAKAPAGKVAGKLKLCRVSGVDEEVRCGRYEVYGMIEAFMIAGNLAGLDTSCLAKTEDLSFALQREELVQ